ncbi:hypothetical protein YPPY13_3365, partial [Yersinia pestis PY-13]
MIPNRFQDADRRPGKGGGR